MLAEAGFQMAFGMINQPSTTPGVSSTIETITGVDGNDITLYIHRPDGTDPPCPAWSTPTAAVWRSSRHPIRATSGGATNSLRPDSSWSASSSATPQASSARTRSPQG